MERRWVRVTIKIIYAGNYLNRPYPIIFFNTNLNQQSCYVSEVHITIFFYFDLAILLFLTLMWVYLLKIKWKAQLLAIKDK